MNYMSKTCGTQHCLVPTQTRQSRTSDVTRMPRLVSNFEYTPYWHRFTSPIMGKHDVIHKTGSTYRITLDRQRRTKPQPQVTCTENFVKFRCMPCMVYEIWERTDRHTDTLIAILRTPPGGGDEVISSDVPIGRRL